MGSVQQIDQDVPLGLPDLLPQLPLLAPRVVGSKLVAQRGTNQQRREMRTEDKADGANSGATSQLDA